MKIFRFPCLAALAALALGGLAAAPAHALPLLAGSVLIPADGSGADPSDGVTLASSSTGFIVAGAFSGTLTTEVIAGASSNPLGGLTFLYQVSNDGAAGPNSIGRMSLASMAGFVIDASYDPASGVAPASIDRNPSGDVIGYNFVPTPIDPLAGFLAPGNSSTLLILHTDAPTYRAAVASLIDGGVITVPTFGPAVPEPSTIVLGLGSLVSLAALRLRRR